MSKTKQIEKLFIDYADKHNEYIIFDGIITEKKHNVLFILKESNIGEDNPDSGIDYTFWFKKVFNAKKVALTEYYNPTNNTLTKPEKSAQTKYYNCIMQIINDLYRYENKDDIGISYININKNGGGNYCDNIGIKDWLETGCKHQFLLKQIDIIKPEKIVIFSCNNSNPLIENFAGELKKLRYDVQRVKYHPSRYKKK